MPPTPDAAFLSASELARLYSCDKLLKLMNGCASRIAAKRKAQALTKQRADDIKLGGGGFFVGLGLLGAAIGFPDLAHSETISATLEVLSIVSGLGGFYLLARDGARRYGIALQAKAAGEAADSDLAFHQRCFEARTINGCR